MEAQAYRARRPKSSPLWQCLDAHFDTFLDIYPETDEPVIEPWLDDPFPDYDQEPVFAES